MGHLQELWDKHSVKLLHNGVKQPVVYEMCMAHTHLYTPTIDNQMIKDGAQFPIRDLLPRRLALKEMLDPQDHTGIKLICMLVSWAQHQYAMKPEIRKRWSGLEAFSTLGVSCLVQTMDRKLILAKRSEDVSVSKSCYHVSASQFCLVEPIIGNGNPEFRTEDQLQQALMKDLKLDIAVQASNPIHIGLCQGNQPDNIISDICFLLFSSFTAEQILAQAKDGDKKNREVIAVTPSEAYDLLCNEKWDTGGAGCLLLYLQWKQETKTR